MNELETPVDYCINKGADCYNCPYLLPLPFFFLCRFLPWPPTCFWSYYKSFKIIGTYGFHEKYFEIAKIITERYLSNKCKLDKEDAIQIAIDTGNEFDIKYQFFIKGGGKK